MSLNQRDIYDDNCCTNIHYSCIPMQRSDVVTAIEEAINNYCSDNPGMCCPDGR